MKVALMLLATIIALVQVESDSHLGGDGWDMEELREMMERMSRDGRGNGGGGYDQDDDGNNGGGDDHDEGDVENNEEDCADDKREDEQQNNLLYMVLKDAKKRYDDLREQREETMKQLKEDVRQFQRYNRAKEYSEMVEERKEKAEEQTKELKEASRRLSYTYHEVSNDYKEEKFKFVYSITQDFLGICECKEDNKNVILRLKDGDFATGGNENQTMARTNSSQGRSFRPPRPSLPPTNGSSSNSSSPLPTPGSMDTDEEDGAVSKEEIMAIVEHLAELDMEELFKYVLNEAIKAMCKSADMLLDHLEDVEDAVLEYKEMRYNSSTPSSLDF